MKLKTITAKVLESLFNTVEEFADLAASKKAAYRHLSSYDREYEWTETKLGKWIENLKREGYIQIQKKEEGERSIEFTNKGKIKIIEFLASQAKLDKINRFISFDIPESLRRERDGFRRALKQMGFVQIQKSLWVANKDVSDLIQIAQYEYRVEKYTAYIVSNYSDIDGIIEKKLEK